MYAHDHAIAIKVHKIISNNTFHSGMKSFLFLLVAVAMLLCVTAFNLHGLQSRSASVMQLILIVKND